MAQSWCLTMFLLLGTVDILNSNSIMAGSYTPRDSKLGQNDEPATWSWGLMPPLHMRYIPTWLGGGDVALLMDRKGPSDEG